ncbi:hypothetical protein L9F63_001456, partial [Diploptera punctata]
AYILLLDEMCKKIDFVVSKKRIRQEGHLSPEKDGICDDWTKHVSVSSLYYGTEIPDLYGADANKVMEQRQEHILSMDYGKLIKEERDQMD